MSLKIDFVEQATKPGAKIAPLCRAFGISRETGHKWVRRFREEGYDGLEERSRRPGKSPEVTGEKMVLALLEAREAHPTWGPKKLVQLLRPKLKRRTPSRATAARILKRFGKIQSRRTRLRAAGVDRPPAVVAEASNAVWTVDFKGWWTTEDGQHCEPLTVRDAFSRFVLTAKRMAGTRADPVREEFERLFRTYGIPGAIQCDNGSPFICTRARGGLTGLSAWWVSLGIELVRSRLGCPQDNGAHERMHRDLRADVQATRGADAHAAQRALDRWRQEFNHVRPHDALGGKVPADVYKPAPRRSLLVSPHAYAEGWLVRRAYGGDGTVSIDSHSYPIGRALRHHSVGFEPIDERTCRVWFRHLDLGLLELAPPRETMDRACERFLDAPGRAGKEGRTSRRNRARRLPTT